jgi:hypothetical protein
MISSSIRNIGILSASRTDFILWRAFGVSGHVSALAPRRYVASFQKRRRVAALQIKTHLFLPAWHHFEQDSFEVFGFGNGGENRMIDRLLEPPEFSRRAARIDQRVRDRL